MKKRIVASALIVFSLIIMILIIWFFISRKNSGKDSLSVKAKKGDFNISITVSGELEAKSCEYIYGQPNLKDIGIWQIKINDMIPEGSVVKKGDYVASLDPTDISNKIKDTQSDLDKNLNTLNKIKLDTALDLRSERDKLSGLKFNLDEAQVTLDQSKYEPPATIRQAKLEVEKDKRNYEQSLKNYKLKLEQDINKVQEIEIAYNNNKDKFGLLNLALKSLTIRASKDGIILYKIDKGNLKIAAGSVINTYSDIVATMPDLSQIISKTNINEIDISKVVPGLDAEITIDAFPDKKFNGKVLSVANIGEDIPGDNAKVFQVKILVLSHDAALKPSMSTKNTILINSLKNVIFIPIECIHSADNYQFVYKITNTGFVKAEVLTGQSNDNEIVITKGIDENDVISLSIPDNADNLELIKLK